MSGEQLAVVIVAIVGGGSVLGVFLRLVFGQREQASTRFVDGHRIASTAKDAEIAAMRQEHRDEMAATRSEFQAAISRLELQRQIDLTGLRDQVARLHRAIAHLVPLVAPEHQSAAIAVLVELGIPATTIGE